MPLKSLALHFPHKMHKCAAGSLPTKPPRDNVSLEPETGTEDTEEMMETPLPQPITKI